MRKFLSLLLFLLLLLVSCPNEEYDSKSSNMKITSLQTVIDNAKSNSIIDLSDIRYKDITNYKAIIDKKLEIKNANCQAETLQINVDDVKLDNVSNVNIKTNSSLKISNSSLSSLKIESIRYSRGITDEIPINVELTNCSITSELNIEKRNSCISANKTTLGNVIFANDNTQLTISDSKKINKIETSDYTSTVILEDGTNDNIPLPEITGAGEITYIDKTMLSSLSLVSLTPFAGMQTVFTAGDTLDFSSLQVMGTYIAQENGVTVYKAGNISYQMQSTFSRLESNFGMKLTQKGSVIEVGSVAKEGEINVRVFIVDVYFDYTVVVKADTKPGNLTGIRLDSSKVKTEYLSGEKLDLSGLIVFAIYKDESGKTYEKIITDYAIDKKQGTKITSETDVCINYNGYVEKLHLNFSNESCRVKYVINEDTIIEKIVAKGQCTTEIKNVSIQGYAFEGWYTTQEYNQSFDFETPISADETIYAKWRKYGDNYTITYKDENGADFSGVHEQDFPTSWHYGSTITLDTPTRIGYTFVGWYKQKDCSGECVTTISGTDFESDFTLYAKWTPKEYNIIYKDPGELEFTGNISGLPVKHTYGSETLLGTPSKIDNEFISWHKIPDCSDQKIDKIGPTDISSDITLYAKWKYGYLDASGDFVVNGVRCKKTSMIDIEGAEDIVCNEQTDSAFNQSRGKVTIPPYSIGKFEVTQQLYKAVMDENPSSNKHLLHPVENMYWIKAAEFCNKLSEFMKKDKFYIISDTTVDFDWSADGYRLPFETEWEFAARGGNYSTTTPWIYKYAGSDDIREVGWYSGNSNNQHHEVGLLKPNSLGIYDMTGNVQELCNEKFIPASNFSSYSYNYYGSDEPYSLSVTSKSVTKGGDYTRSENANNPVISRHGQLIVVSEGSDEAFRYGFRIAYSR